jgi:hypothetical protein
MATLAQQRDVGPAGARRELAALAGKVGQPPRTERRKLSMAAMRSPVLESRLGA